MTLILLLAAPFLPGVLASPICPEDFQPWYDNVCGYTKINAGGWAFNFPYALQTCLDRGSNLPSIHSSMENTKLFNAVIASTGQDWSQRGYGEFWIGLQCRNMYQFSWLDGTPFDYLKQFYNNDTSVTDCSSDHPWDPQCDSYNGTSKCLQSYPNPLSWTNAETSCNFAGGHLVSIHSEEENSFIRRYAIANGHTNGIHIGLTNGNPKAPSWNWTDGTLLNYTNYGEGNSNTGAGSCSKMTADGKWITIDCNAKLPFICENTANQVQSPGCSEKRIFLKNDHIFSPCFPLRVESGECEYTVKASNPNAKVALRVEFFNIHMCCHQLLIYDGPEGSNLLSKLSGHVAPGTIITATGREMRLVWNVREEGRIEGWHFTVIEVDD